MPARPAAVRPRSCHARTGNAASRRACPSEGDGLTRLWPPRCHGSDRRSQIDKLTINLRPIYKISRRVMWTTFVSSFTQGINGILAGRSLVIRGARCRKSTSSPHFCTCSPSFCTRHPQAHAQKSTPRQTTGYLLTHASDHRHRSWQHKTRPSPEPSPMLDGLSARLMDQGQLASPYSCQ
jgi:hypothetical protein